VAAAVAARDIRRDRWAGERLAHALGARPGLPAEVAVSGSLKPSGGDVVATIRLTNRTDHVAFFLRAELTKGPDGEEILPVLYDDNY
jgi:hypothetical protein